MESSITVLSDTFTQLNVVDDILEDDRINNIIDEIDNVSIKSNNLIVKMKDKRIFIFQMNFCKIEYHGIHQNFVPRWQD